MIGSCNIILSSVYAVCTIALSSRYETSTMVPPTEDGPTSSLTSTTPPARRGDRERDLVSKTQKPFETLINFEKH